MGVRKERPSAADPGFAKYVEGETRRKDRDDKFAKRRRLRRERRERREAGEGEQVIAPDPKIGHEEGGLIVVYHNGKPLYL